MKHEHFNGACAQIGRTIAARIFPDQDVLETIEEICSTYNIRYGQISSCIGSLRHVVMNYVDREVPTKAEDGYTTRVEMSGGFSLLAGQGLVSPADEEGKLNIHLHFTFTGKNNVVYGGHILRGTRSLTTIDLFITELNGIKIRRFREESTGVVVSAFEEDTSEI